MILIKDNVERKAEREDDIQRLKSQGFKPLSKIEPEMDENANTKDVGGMKVAQLRAMAKEKGIEGSDSLSKEELLAVLKDVV